MPPDMEQVTDVVATADRIAAELLGDLRTKLGGRHIDHARRVAAVAQRAGNGRLVAAAYLHDVVEKGGVRPDVLRELVRDDDLVDLVLCLTQRSGEAEHDYLARCAADDDAYVLKRLDLRDKLLADDETVSPASARAVRRRTVEKLALLEQLREGRVHPHSGGGRPPDGA